MIKTESWCGYDIRFIEKDGEWWAILKDICDALDLRTAKVAERLDPEMLIRVPVPVEVPSKDVDSQTYWMLAINEVGIYEALFASRRLEARKFRRWSATVMKKLRSQVGLEGYEVMRMTEPEIQEDINHILDTLYWDEETGKLMQSITVQGGDVDQVPFEQERRKNMKTNETKEIRVRPSTLYVAATVVFYLFYRMGISQGRKEVINNGK